MLIGFLHVIAKAPEYLAKHGVREYMKYAETKLQEEEERAKKYLEMGLGSDSVSKVTFTRCQQSKRKQWLTD